MSRIVIKKRVSLDFLGDEQKESYLLFKAISLSDYEKLVKEVDTSDEQKALDLIKKILSQQFIEGKYSDTDGQFEVKVEELTEFDMTTILKIFNDLMGRDLNPNLDQP